MVGNAIEEQTECGPLIRPREVDRVATWVDEARTGGARILSGGEKLGATTYAPTVLLNPPKDAKVSTMEIFGPAICVYASETLDQGDSTGQCATPSPFKPLFLPKISIRR